MSNILPKCQWDDKKNNLGVAILNILPNFIWISYLAKSALPITQFLGDQSFWNFAPRMTMILLCSAKYWMVQVHSTTECMLNSSPPSDACIRQWIGSALVQIMACRLFGTKPLSKPMQSYCQLDLRNKLKWNFNQNTKLFIHKNVSENIVCEMAAILSRRRWVKSKWDLSRK